MTAPVPPVWVVLPYRNNLDLTLDAIASVLDQTVPTRVLVIGQGVSRDLRTAVEREAAQQPDRLLAWHFDPPLRSLAAVWNLGLRFCWQAGPRCAALVVNNDLVLPRHYAATLIAALTSLDMEFLSGVGVPPADYDPHRAPPPLGVDTPCGGPDFSAFLITQALHEDFPFDEGFEPAFCEDLDYHRRLLLAGRGRQIGSIDVPYLHHGSQTLHGLPEAERRRVEGQISAGARAYYARKWGGPVNQETYWVPFDPESASGDGRATTPALQAAAAQGSAVPTEDPIDE